jgi:U3 small nucleolar RNA-associated protein 20
MVMQADNPAIRHAASTLFLNFLLRYPLGPKRLQQHLNFLVTNLGYPVAVGREALLALITTLVDKLPLPVLHRQMDLLLLPLVTRLVNDDHQACRKAVAKVITHLVARACEAGAEPECDAARGRLFKLIRLWSGDETYETAPKLHRAAAQLAGLTIEALGTAGAALAVPLVPLLVGSCEREADAPPEAPSRAHPQSAGAPPGDSDEMDEAGGGGVGSHEAAGAVSSAVSSDEEPRVRWQGAYYSLRALERLAQPTVRLTKPNGWPVLLGEGFAPLWAPLQRLLLHEHAWVRAAAGRLIGALLATQTPESFAAAMVREGEGQLEGQLAATESADGVGKSGAVVGKMGAVVGKTGKRKGGAPAALAAVEGAVVGATGAVVGVSGPPPPFFCRVGALVELATALVQQLHSAVISEAAAAQATKNLLWLCVAFLKQPNLAPISSQAILRDTAAAVATGVARERISLSAEIGARNGARAAKAAAEAAAAESSAHDSAAPGALLGASWSCWALEAVAARLAPLTHTPGQTRGCAAMRWVAAIAAQLSPEQLRAMLPLLVAPVARAAEDRSGKVHGAVQEMANEALQLLQRRAEAPAFVAAYQHGKEAQKAAKRERLQREALEAVADPERAAQKRIAINQGKRKQKKRKLEKAKRTRDSGGSVGLGKRRRD